MSTAAAYHVTVSVFSCDEDVVKKAVKHRQGSDGSTRLDVAVGGAAEEAAATAVITAAKNNGEKHNLLTSWIIRDSTRRLIRLAHPCFNRGAGSGGP